MGLEHRPLRAQGDWEVERRMVTYGMIKRPEFDLGVGNQKYPEVLFGAFGGRGCQVQVCEVMADATRA